MDGTTSPYNPPTKLTLDASITSLHFSATCKELVSTHGPGKTPAPATHLAADDADPFLDAFLFDHARSRLSNSVAVHHFASLQHVATLSAGADTQIAGSLLSPSGQKLLLAVPAEGKLKLWDVWGKSALKRYNSAFGIDRKIR